RLANTEGNGMAPFLYLPHVCYVMEYGVDHLETSLDLQYELTKRFSAEYSIRVFLDRYPQETLARLREWAHDPDVHVRRLVSEGTRPRLPWAPRLRAFQKDPSPVLELLELLKDDPELYVRRSVANNLNDIGKDQPEVLFQTCRRWLIDASEDRQWLIKHALRSAVKRGESGALQVLGYGAAPQVSVKQVSIKPKRAEIGGKVELSFTVVNTARRKQSLLVDYSVFFVKADTSTSPKVFKLTTLELAAGESAVLSSRIGLRQMTTRKHYPGTHRVEIIVNGVAFPAGSFSLK
ncbi:MAG: DNA alkylation repair protein, partial [Pseudomonas sp.]